MHCECRASNPITPEVTAFAATLVRDGIGLGAWPLAELEREVEIRRAHMVDMAQFHHSVGHCARTSTHESGRQWAIAVAVLNARTA